ncbi:MAG: Gfo/Idh/MocA family oxidoreductase [Kiritimatiellae bacterium]|nr:Gfo/Idh/MocA family oxidoreductase [Kiritimatiellia bacterium]
MKRRDFVKMGTGAFFIAASGKALGADAPSNRIRLALVGCHAKGRGASVMKSILKVPGLEIAWVCDVDSRARDFAADAVQKIAGYTPKKEKDLRKVLEDPLLDGIVSETPDHWHALSAVMAMRAGKHVYVEKPCAFCPREGEILLDTWKKTGKVLQVGSQRRSAESIRKAIADIRAESLIGDFKWGKSWYMTRRAPIGKGKPCAVPEWLDWDIWQGPAPREALRDNVIHYNWHWFRNWGTGETGNNSVHFVDIARWCMGLDYPERVVSTGGRYWIPSDTDWEWPDMHNVSWEFPGGKVITWEGLCCTNIKPYMGVSAGSMVYGDKGSALFTPSGTVDVFDMKGKLVHSWTGNVRTSDGKALTNTDNRSGGWNDSTLEHFQNFAACIRDNTPLKANANAEVGVKSTYLALAANVAYFTGGVMKVDPATGRPVDNPAAMALWSREYAKGWELV